VVDDGVSDVSGTDDRLLGQVLVSANSSLTQRGAAVFFGLTAGASLLIASAFAFQGFWPILPFAGVELFALGLALGLSMKRGRYREVISVYQHRIVVEKGAGSIEERVELPRAWTRVELLRPPWRGHPGRLLLCCHGKRREVGAVLTEAERERLRLRLTELITVQAAGAGTGTRPETNDLG
jgi:uncharacterized membrane protein